MPLSLETQRVFRRDRRLTPLFVKVGKQAVPLVSVARVDGERLERLEVDLHLLNGEVITAYGIDAVELMMQVKPVMVEGHRLRYGRWDWLVHNLVGHPLMQLLAVFRLYHWAFWVHDATVPRPRGRHPRTEAAMASEARPSLPACAADSFERSGAPGAGADHVTLQPATGPGEPDR